MVVQLTFPQRLDNRIAITTQRLWTKYHLLDSLAIVIARFTPLIMIGLLILISQGFLLSAISRGFSFWSAVVSVCSALLGRVLNEPITRLVSRRRPFEELQFYPLMQHDRGGSFPSNHSTGAFALALGCIHIPGYNIILCILAALLALSRVYCGIHYASDVVLGALHGILAGCFCLWIFFFIQNYGSFLS